MKQEPKTTIAFAWSNKEHPEIRNISTTKYCQEVSPVVVVWQDEFEDMRRELGLLRMMAERQQREIERLNEVIGSDL